MTNRRSFGPAMQALSPRRRQFVLAYCEMGSSMKAAALAAGYGSERERSAEVAAWRLSHEPKVQAAIAEEAQKRLNASAILAATAMMEIVSDPLHKDRFKAADRLLERGGLMVTTKHEINVKDDRTTAQLEAFIREKAAELGLDPVKLLGRRAPVTLNEVLDAEFEEVEDDLSDCT